ncbi:ABC transporter substrate-binding protein [Cupriavidus sp. CV2]|uniref:ABC transporter substrate-binding protein n=1 Tax=Cupriavidus ulmosensis TaxID=3065913 RepID=UPI00296AF710|nr:ABC transporter substrate-binding protein [Cupriavidus sp. CV2]MDW3688876.1 ABC transporter substrate-binding protein [Cupriavidus sp. CV2]
MTRRYLFAAILYLLSLVGFNAAAQTVVRVGWCARTLSTAAAPFAVAMKMGWYARDGIKVELMPLAGSTDCVKLVATKELPYSNPSVEPLAIIRQQGVKAKIFYTAYQGNIYGLAVPQGSAITKIADLKDKTIGVTSMGSAGVIIARALAANAGLNPDRDIRLVVAGEGAQTAALLRTGQVDALSQFDTQYAMVENAGVKLRLLSTKEIERFPSNGFLALEETLRTNHKQAVALAQGYAKGTVFTIANPEAAIRILWEIFPETKPTGIDESTAIREGVKTLEARIPNWDLKKSGVSKWGESSEKNYSAYTDFMQKWGVTKEKVPVNELITNELIDEINNFSWDEVIATARAYKAR